MGGNSLNVGSVPSKAIIRTARRPMIMRDAEEFGAPGIARTRRRFPDGDGAHAPNPHANSGISFGRTARASGRGCLLRQPRGSRASDTLLVDDAPMHFKKALDRHGRAPQQLRHSGPRRGRLSHQRRRSSRWRRCRSAWPSSAAARSAAKLAQAFCRLGSHVTIVQNDPKFLPREERDAAEILSWSMARDGMDIRLNTTVLGAASRTASRFWRPSMTMRDTGSRPTRFWSASGACPMSRGSVWKPPASRSIRDRASGRRFPAHHEPARLRRRRRLPAVEIHQCRAILGPHGGPERLAARRQRHSLMTIPWCTYCDPEIAHIGLHVWDAGEVHLRSRASP